MSAAGRAPRTRAATAARRVGTFLRAEPWAKRSALTRARFVFWGLALLFLLLAAAMLVFTSNASVAVRSLAGVGLVWIAARDVAIQRNARLLPLLAPLDACALVAVAAANGTNPSLGVFFLGIFYRSLYGRRRAVAVTAVAYLAAYLTAAFILGAGGTASLETGLDEGLGIVFCAAVMHVVAETLLREERTRGRERLLRHVSAELVAARTDQAIYDAALSATLGLLPAGAPARVTIWRRRGNTLTAVAAAGDAALGIPGTTIPLEALSPAHVAALSTGGVMRFGPDTAADDRPPLPFPPKAGGTLVIPLNTPNEALGAMNTSSDDPLPAELEDALLAIASQVALALESVKLTADLHRQQSEQRFSSLIANASDMITVVSRDGRITYQTPSIERALGHDARALVGRPITDLIHPDDVEAAVGFLDRCASAAGGTSTGEWRIAHGEGGWRNVEVVAGDLTDDPKVRGIVLTSRDVTERKALEHRLAHQAFHDSLTGLPNRDLFRDRIEHAIARASRRGCSAILFIDVDDFKNVNDTLGHAAGDRLLTQIAERLRGCLRTGDTASRLGGDEFGVLLEDVEHASIAVGAAMRVLAALEQPLPLGNQDIPVRVSIGVAMAERAISSADALLRNADIAMYAAKGQGKGCVRLFEPEMYEEMVDRIELHEDLARAVERRELKLLYQPIVELATGRAVAAEALLHWQHPERGLLSPSEFVPLAEETGLIVSLGRWVTDEACRQLREWRDEAPEASELRMSINVSPGQLADPCIVEDIPAALRTHELDAESIILEITESAVMADLDSAITRLERLASLGVQLALDDFGSGYSSLSHLQRFPLRLLKLDSAFTGPLKTEAHEDDLSRAIVELAQTLGLAVVAEGVEEARQAARLLEMGCLLAQGHHFAPPLPADRALTACIAPTGSLGRR